MMNSKQVSEDQYDINRYAEQLINEEWGDNKGSQLLEKVDDLKTKVESCEQKVRNFPSENAEITKGILQEFIHKNQRLEEQIESMNRTNEDLLSEIKNLRNSIEKMNRPNIVIRSFKSAMEGIKDRLVTAFDAVRSAFSQFKEKAGKLNESLKDSIKDKMNKASESLSNAKENLMESLSNFKEIIKEIPGKILEAVKGIATSIKETSKDVSDKAVKGIKSAGTAIKDAAKTAKDSIKENAPKVAKAAAIGAAAVAIAPVTVPVAAAVSVGALAKNVAKKAAEKAGSAKDNVNLEVKKLSTPSYKEIKKLNRDLKEAKGRLESVKEETGKTRYGSVESLSMEQKLKKEESKISKLESKQIKGEMSIRKYESFRDKVGNKEEKRSESVGILEGTKQDISNFIDKVKNMINKDRPSLKKDVQGSKSSFVSYLEEEKSKGQSQGKGSKSGNSR